MIADLPNKTIRVIKKTQDIYHHNFTPRITSIQFCNDYFSLTKSLLFVLSPHKLDEDDCRETLFIALFLECLRDFLDVDDLTLSEPPDEQETLSNNLPFLD